MARINYSQLTDIYLSLHGALLALNRPQLITGFDVVPEHQAALDTDHPDATIFISFRSPLYTKDFMSIFESEGEMGLPFNNRRSCSGYMRSLNLAVDTSHAICNPDKVRCAVQQFDYLMRCTDLENKLLEKGIDLPTDFNEKWAGFRHQIKQAKTEEGLHAIFQQVSAYYMSCKEPVAPCSHASAQTTLLTGSKPTNTNVTLLNKRESFNIDKT